MNDEDKIHTTAQERSTMVIEPSVRPLAGWMHGVWSYLLIVSGIACLLCLTYAIVLFLPAFALLAIFPASLASFGIPLIIELSYRRNPAIDVPDPTSVHPHP